MSCCVGGDVVPQFVRARLVIGLWQRNEVVLKTLILFSRSGRGYRLLRVGRRAMSTGADPSWNSRSAICYY